MFSAPDHDRTPTTGEWLAIAERAVTALESIAITLAEATEGMKREVHHCPVPMDEPSPVPLDDSLIDVHLGGDPPQEVPEIDAAALAREAEELLNSVATPDVKTTVEVGEKVERAPKEVVPINLFSQQRTNITDLAERAPDDPIIKAMVEKVQEKFDAKDQPSMEDHIRTAAIELVYTYLPFELWGTDVAEKQIKEFVEAHRGDV